MTVTDSKMLAWFLKLRKPVSTLQFAKQWGLSERTARRRMNVWMKAELAVVCGVGYGGERRFGNKRVAKAIAEEMS